MVPHPFDISDHPIARCQCCKIGCVKVDDSITLKIGTAAVRATIEQIERVINVDALTSKQRMHSKGEMKPGARLHNPTLGDEDDIEGL